VQDLIQKLEEAKAWAAANQSFDHLASNDDYMSVAVALGNHVRFTMAISAASTPDPQLPGYDRAQAVIFGLFVRMYKLFDALCFHVSESHGEIATIFIRLILEARIRMRYLIAKGPESAADFIFVSYKSTKERLQDFPEKQNSWELLKIEERMLRHIRLQLEEADIDESELLRNTRWRHDGKTFKGLMQELRLEDWYPYLFAAQSSTVHGDWRDIRSHHVFRDGDYYKARLVHDNVDIRYLCPVSRPCLAAVREFLAWNKADPDGFVHDVATHLDDLAARLDAHHEERCM